LVILPQRAAAAFPAISDRCSAVGLAAPALPLTEFGLPSSAL